ncbi:MAG: tRNA lysidine(34) synthetase TilS [Acidobacteriota bacterium]
MDAFEKAVLKTIQRYHLLKSGDCLIVGLSGGADSVALLLALKGLKEELPLQLRAAHANHRLRGRDSEEDQRFVTGLCQDLDLPLEIERFSTRVEAAQAGQNLEEFARRQRYEFFFGLARRHMCRVATGHTLNDQAETFLMKLARGSGPAGLSGIYPFRTNQAGDRSQEPPVIVVRPLLEQSRAEIVRYLARRKQKFQRDVSNEDLSFERNWVRHELVPLLEEKLNPELIQTIGRTAGLFREVNEWLKQEAMRALERVCKKTEEEEDGGLVLNRTEVRSYPDILQKEIIRQAIRQVRGKLSGITSRHVNAILGLFEGISGREVCLPGELMARREFNDIRFSKGAGCGDFCYKMDIPGEIFVEEAAKHVKAVRPERSMGNDEKRFSLNFQGNSLVVRNRRPGDRYRISAQGPEKKLKKVLMEARIPRSRRDRLLVFEAQDRIVWVEGLPLHPDFRLSGEAAHLLVIEIRRETL